MKDRTHYRTISTNMTLGGQPASEVLFVFYFIHTCKKYRHRYNFTQLVYMGKCKFKMNNFRLNFSLDNSPMLVCYCLEKLSEMVTICMRLSGVANPDIDCLMFRNPYFFVWIYKRNLPINIAKAKIAGRVANIYVFLWLCLF